MDSYRPNRQQRERPSQQPAHSPTQSNAPRGSRNGPPPPAFQFGRGGGDSYRPRDPHDRDQFKASQINLGNHPTYPPTYSHDFPSHRPRQATEHRNGIGNVNGNSQQSYDHNRQTAQQPYAPRGPRRGRGGRYQGTRQYGRPPQKPSTRPLMETAKRATTPDQMSGMSSSQPKFKALEDISEEDEDNKQLSGVDGADDSDEPPRKKISLSINIGSAANAAPRWSNPDPYTVLPPPPETTEKKTNVVGLIRKGRLSSLKDEAAGGNSSDFISLNDEGSAKGETGVGVNVWPSPQTRPSMPNLGATQGRKRSREEIVEMLDPGEDVQQPPKQGRRGQMKHGKSPPAVVIITDAWKPRTGISPTPWFDANTSSVRDKALLQLHKEIVDFYDYVKPEEFERELRLNLVDRVQSFLDQNYDDCVVRFFGSFHAGVFLPNSDMDLVVMSHEFIGGGPATCFQSNKSLFKLRGQLLRQNIAKEGSVAVVTKAKVPLVKYVDKLTNLRVDISFENETGIKANEVNTQWKTKYPAMLVLVPLVKQFLMMRGLNEVFNGGLGGFSVTCLVVSFLHLKVDDIKPKAELGETFRRFLDHYGNHFDTAETAIRFNPPAYFSKRAVQHLTNQDKDKYRLCIIDPNNPNNNISGGTSKIHLIFEAFSDGARKLDQALKEAKENQTGSTRSILGCILAGNYSQFHEQRERMRAVEKRNVKGVRK